MKKTSIRFNDSDGSKFPNWEVLCIEDLIQRGYIEPPIDGNHGAIHPKTSDYVEKSADAIPFVMASDVCEGKIDLDNCKYISKETALGLRKGFAKDNDVILTHKATVGNVAVLHLEDREYAVLTPQTTYYRIIQHDKLNEMYIRQFFESPYFQAPMKSESKQATRDYIGILAQHELPFLLPTLSEQNKIAEFLSQLDLVVSSSREEIENLELLKRGMIQKIFLHEIRFKNANGENFQDWETVQFGDLVKEYKEKTKVENEDTLLSCAIDGMYLNSELFVHQRGKSNIGYLKIKKNTLILSAQNLHLGNANVNTRFESGIISPAYKTFDIVGCLPEFMKVWIEREETKKFFFDATTVGASECRRNVDWNRLYEQTLKVPCIQEQISIIEFFKSIDDAIIVSKEEFKKYKELKKGLLQQMFV